MRALRDRPGCTSLVINAKAMDSALASLHCAPAATCPSAGGCVTHEYLCVKHTCKIVFANETGFRERERKP